MTPPGQQEMGEPADGGRRGKPKRRRFNFNVLENLEKMVQPKPADSVPATSWTPPAPALGTQPNFSQAPPAQASAGPVPPAGSPNAEPTSKPAAANAPSLSLPFGERPTQAPEAKEPQTTAAEETAPEPDPWRTSESKRDDGPSMRSMMFGEEPSSAESVPEREPVAASEPAAEPAQVVAEPAWASYSWSRTSEASSSVESEPVNAEVQPFEDSGATAPSEAEAATDSSTVSHEDWKSHDVSLSEGGNGAPAEPEAVPAVDASDGEQSQDTGASGGDKSGAGTLVIIEDDATAATYYSTLFRGNGYQVEVANDGVSGVDLCAKVQPQVILLDVMMPRQNGILVLQTLRASDETKNTPVVVMSNFSEPTLIKRALQLGALEYVIKTQVEGPALLNAIPRWMNREKAFAAA